MNFFSANGEYKVNNVENFGNLEKKDSLKKFKMLTPATLSKFYEKSGVAIVNTLENPNFIVKKPFLEKYLKLLKQF